VQLSAIFIACFALFYISYKKVTKKNPDLLVIIAYLLSFSLFSYYLINISMLLERVTHRGGFGLSNSLFINTALICFGLMLSNFDLPTIDSFRKGFFSIKENIYKYLGVILTLCFVIAYIGLVNTTFIYVISIIPVFINLYLLKIWLSNIRK
jgi:ribose/xylose/arabinose/galactoside ABC-type transport system permease subunit